MRLRVLEMGTFFVPAYAGMLLAEQGHQVTKIIHPSKPDPILTRCRHGQDLWDWVNWGKQLCRELLPDYLGSIEPGAYDVVLENIRQTTWGRWLTKTSLAELAEAKGIRWIGVRDELGCRSFDNIAQARAFLEFSPRVNFYLGDTAVALFAAFKALADTAPGFFPIYQASSLFKLVEGEMVVGANHARPMLSPQDDYWAACHGCDEKGAFIRYRDEMIREPIRGHEWRWENLRHREGRIII